MVQAGCFTRPSHAQSQVCFYSIGGGKAPVVMVARGLLACHGCLEQQNSPFCEERGVKYACCWGCGDWLN